MGVGLNATLWWSLKRGGKIVRVPCRKGMRWEQHSEAGNIVCFKLNDC